MTLQTSCHEDPLICSSQIETYDYKHPRWAFHYTVPHLILMFSTFCWAIHSSVAKTSSYNLPTQMSSRNSSRVLLDLDDQLEKHDVHLEEDSKVCWNKTNSDHPRNWDVFSKYYTTVLICWLELYMTGISSSGVGLYVLYEWQQVLFRWQLALRQRQRNPQGWNTAWAGPCLILHSSQCKILD